MKRVIMQYEINGPMYYVTEKKSNWGLSRSVKKVSKSECIELLKGESYKAGRLKDGRKIVIIENFKMVA